MKMSKLTIEAFSKTLMKRPFANDPEVVENSELLMSDELKP